MRRLIVFLALVLLTLAGCAQFRACSDDPQCVRVLFIGNSYTFVNDLPAMLTNLAKSGGQRLETGLRAEGGWTLAQHADSADTSDQITSSKWNFVVLQEQSQIPASQTARETGMYPAARRLAVEIKKSGAVPLLFITWAHRDGWPEIGLPGYESMQFEINNGYSTLGKELNASLAPVGVAWLTVRRLYPQIELWQADGSHPTEKGTYLAACVFYAIIFHKSPEGLAYRGSLAGDEAGTLQKIAAETVLLFIKKWDLP